MTPEELRAHKMASKRLLKRPQFTRMRKQKYPKPFNRTGGSRIQCSGLIEVSDKHVIFLLWKDGPLLSDTSFFGYLLHRTGNRALWPLLEMHWHPSHKPIHCRVPCRTERDYTNRTLPGAPEFIVSNDTSLDPRLEGDRERLIAIFCRACGITMGEAPSLTGFGPS